MPAPLAFAAASAGPAAGACAQSKVEHAFLQLHEPPVNRKNPKLGPKRSRIAFQFNPKDLTLSKSAKWGRGNQKASTPSAPPHYQGPEPKKLSLEISLDASDTRGDSVVKTVEQLFAGCVPPADSHRQKIGCAPWV